MEAPAGGVVIDQLLRSLPVALSQSRVVPYSDAVHKY